MEPKIEIKYEIFTSLEAIEIKDIAINQLLGYPNLQTKTDQYRLPEKHPAENLWCGIVGPELTNKCEEMKMTPEEIAQYYDVDNLFTMDYLKDHGWFTNQIGA